MRDGKKAVSLSKFWQFYMEFILCRCHYIHKLDDNEPRFFSIFQIYNDFHFIALGQAQSRKNYGE